MSEAVKRFIWRAPIYEASTEMTDLYPDGIQYVLATDHDRIVAELHAQIEREVSATNAECNDWAREHVMRMQVMDERDALRAEVERLRKDAERYRWLRDHGATASWEEGGVEIRSNPGHLDDAVDESIAIALEASR